MLTKNTTSKFIPEFAHVVTFPGGFLKGHKYFSGGWVSVNENGEIQKMGTSANDILVGQLDRIGRNDEITDDNQPENLDIRIQLYSFIKVESQGNGATEFPQVIPNDRRVYFIDDETVSFDRPSFGNTPKVHSDGYYVKSYPHPVNRTDKGLHLIKLVTERV